MRKCPKCGVVKDCGSFYTKRSTYCKECAKKAAKDSYRKNKEKVKNRSKKQRKGKQRLVANLKNHPCEDCGRAMPSELMHFDHVRGGKVDNLARMVSNNRKVGELLAEIHKCEVVCVLCHRNRTYMRGKHPIVSTRHRELLQSWLKN